MTWTCMKKFRVWTCTNISRKILQGFTLWNFVQWFIEQQGVKLISICRAARKEYTWIYLVFFCVVLYFLHIFEVIRISEILNKNKNKNQKIAAQCWTDISAQGTTLLAWPSSTTALRWKGEDHRLGRLRSGVCKADAFKVVAPACVG
jgi:hypothetical protein